MCYDVSASHRHDVEQNRKRMKEIEKEFPDTFFTNKEWRRLVEDNRMHDMFIRDYNKKIKMGVKF
jgi:hypothetical protein